MEKTGSVNDSIEDYARYFRQKIDDVQKVEPRRFRKILFACIIDTLALAGNSDTLVQAGNSRKKKTHGRNGERFVQFIDKFSHWQEKDTISAQQLLLKLNDTETELYRKAKSLVDSWPPTLDITSDKDLSPDMARALVTLDEQDYVTQCRYAQLLYRYRNSLIHEVREPGRCPMEFSGDPDTPFYHPNFDNVSEPWQLVFPSSFFCKLCADCLFNLVEALRIEGRDPYKVYRFTDVW